MPAGATIRSQERESSGFERSGVGTLLRRYLLILLGGLVLGLIGALIYLNATPKQYTAVTSLWIDPRTSSTSAPSNVGLAIELAQTQGQTLRSAAVLAPVIDRLDYESMSMFKGVDDPIEQLRKGLSTHVSEHGLLYVKLSGRGSKDSIRRELTDSLDAIVANYMSYMVRRNDDAAEQIRARMLKDREALVEEVDAAQTALTSWRQKNAASEPEANAATQRATALARALADAERDAVRAKSVYDDAVGKAGPDLAGLSEKQLEDALSIASVDGDDLSRQAELSATRRQLDQLSKTLLPNHPSVVRLQQRLRQLTIAEVASARKNWIQTNEEIEGLRKSLDESTKELARADSGSAERLKREETYRRAEARLADLDKSLSEKLINTRMGDLSVQVVAPAAVDESREPPTPRANRVVPAGALLGLAMALMASLVFQSRSDWRPFRLAARPETTNAPTKSESVEQIPLLASLPALPDASVESAAWATQLDPTGNYARAVRVLRKSVEIENSLPATFVFAPIASGDGATTVASNLAMLLAREGRKIILVDIGFGQSSIERALDLKPTDESEKTLGLADALNGAELVSAIRTTSIPGLDAMPAGTLPEHTDSRALLDSPKMGELITHLAAAYDHVIFDTPSITHGDDTRLIAALADATVMVARAGSTSRNDLIEARNQLQMLGANVIGLVIRNDSTGSSN